MSYQSSQIDSNSYHNDVNNVNIAPNYSSPYLNMNDKSSKGVSHSSVISRAATNVPSVAFSSGSVPTLMESLMNPVTVVMPGQSDAPTLTNVVYVGGLCSDTTNEFIINMLQKCGRISHFKRHTDPSSGLLANFAFCDFESPGGAYYATETLNNLNYKDDNKIKISCNAKVKGQISEWREKKLEELRSHNPESSEDEILGMMESVKNELISEFMELIRLHQLEPPQPEPKEEGEIDVKKEQTVSRKDSQVSRELPTKSNIVQRAVSPSKRNTVSDLLTYTSREYTIHRKESHRRGKVKSKKRTYDDRFRHEEPEWIREEEKLLRRLQRIGTVKQSLREELIKDDLSGKTRPNPKIRQHEKEQDLLDEQEEAAEIATTEAKRTIPLPTAQPPAEPPKKKVANVFSHLDDPDEDPVFKRKHKPLAKIRNDQEIWSEVPTNEDDVFGYKLDWELLFSTDTTNMLLEPWIKKCIKEYMGDEDALINDVIEFIMGRLKESPSYSELLFDVEQFLDDESKGFVLELWRLLIFQNIKLGT